jgi:hypothetical protein
MNSVVFWDMTPCSHVVHHSFVGSFCLSLQGKRISRQTDEDITFLRNVSEILPRCTASHPRKKPLYIVTTRFGIATSYGLQRRGVGVRVPVGVGFFFCRIHVVQTGSGAHLAPYGRGTKEKSQTPSSRIVTPKYVTMSSILLLKFYQESETSCRRYHAL